MSNKVFCFKSAAFEVGKVVKVTINEIKADCFQYKKG